MAWDGSGWHGMGVDGMEKDNTHELGNIINNNNKNNKFIKRKPLQDYAFLVVIVNGLHLKLKTVEIYVKGSSTKIRRKKFRKKKKK